MRHVWSEASVMLGPDLDDRRALALGGGVEETRPVLGFDVIDGLAPLAFQIDRSISTACVDARTHRYRLFHAIGIDDLDFVQGDGAITNRDANSPEAAFVASDRNGVLVEADEACRVRSK